MVDVRVTAGPLSATDPFSAAAPVADAILYEGYLLYPYRRSSSKNRVRWQFGVLLPPEWAQAHGLTDTGVAGSAESSWAQSECLLLAPRDATVTVRLRFLQCQQRIVERRDPDGFRPVDRAVVDGRLELTFDEAVPREHDVSVTVADLLTHEVNVEIDAYSGDEVDGTLSLDGHRVVRHLDRVQACMRIDARPIESTGPIESSGIVRLRVRVDNTGGLGPDATREEALRRGMLATHVLLGTDAGRFLSLLDPPEWAAEEVRHCTNVHVFPVLADAADAVMLAAPVILYDHPSVAPESPGDLHDAAEIDEILSLRTLTLTDAEKAEARATDPRAAAIVDRVDAMQPEVFDRLHGVIRTIQAPPVECVVIAGVTVRKGSRVRLHPRSRGTDVHDMFLADRSAVVEAVLVDVDDQRHVVVTIEDDPAAELNRWYGRYRYFAPDEVEPLETP